MYRQSYFPHLQDSATRRQKNVGFGAADPMMGIFRNAINLSAKNSHFHKEHAQSTSTFIPEPRISAQVPKLPLFFSQPQPFFNDEIPLQPSPSNCNGCLVKPTKNKFPSLSPLQLQPSPILERASGHNLSDRSNIYANGIMSENVQQRYLFSKNPNYGPLSIPSATTYHPVMHNTRDIQDSGFFGREESQNYNYKLRSFGRRSSDAREPMPKLGQGDARLGDGTLFGERKANNHSNSKNRVSGFYPTVTCKVLASPSSLTSCSPKSTISSYRPNADTSRLGARNTRSKSPQRSSVPIPVGPVPEKSKRSPPEQSQTPLRIENHQKPYAQEGCEEHQIPQMPINQATSLLVEADAETVPGVTITPIPTGPKKMASNYQLNATAAEFKPVSRRVRPSKWNVQCKWGVGCRFGSACHWGHEGDEYIDTPGVKYTFKKSSFKGNACNGEANGQTYYSQIHYEQNKYDQAVQYNLSEYSTSPSHLVQQSSDYRVRQHIDRMPDFSSWVGGATSVDGQDMNDYPVYKYVDNQLQIPTILYEDATSYNSVNVYENFHTQRQPETLNTLTGSMRGRKHSKKRTVIKSHRDKANEEGSLVGRQIEENFQDPQVKDDSLEKESEPTEKKLRDLHAEDTESGKCAV